LYLVYTGVADGKQVQAVANSADGVNFTKYAGNPVIGEALLPQNSNIADFRDPKVWAKDGVVYMIVSSRNATNQYSKLLLYKSTNMTDWTYAGKLFANNSNYQPKLGIMFECPDLITLDGRDIIIVSPQTVPNHRNSDANVYILGKVNYATGVFEDWNYDSIRQLDYGFDFYAPQTMVTPDGRTIMVAWMQSWNRRPIYAATGIAGALTFPRELTLIGEDLYQTPVRELANYFRGRYQVSLASNTGIVYDSELSGWSQNIEIEFTPGSGKSGVSVFDDGLGNGMKIYYENGQVVLERYGVTTGQYAAVELHNVTSVDCPLVEGKVKLRLIIDRYSCEVFVQDGYRVMTATAFPNENQTRVGVFSDQGVIFDVIKHSIVIE
jgi:beta-fructofuranosidase